MIEPAALLGFLERLQELRFCGSIPVRLDSGMPAAVEIDSRRK